MSKNWLSSNMPNSENTNFSGRTQRKATCKRELNKSTTSTPTEPTGLLIAGTIWRLHAETPLVSQHLAVPTRWTHQSMGKQVEASERSAKSESAGFF